MPPIEEALEAFITSFSSSKRMSSHASDAQMFLFATCLEALSPGLAEELSQVTFEYGEGPYDSVEISAILKKAKGITPDKVLESFASEDFWGGVLTPRDALGLADPLSDLWIDFLVPTNATEAAGLLALIMHLPHIDHRMIPRAVHLADQILPYLHTPEVKHVIVELPKVFARSPAAENLTFEQRQTGAFAMHDYFDEIGLLLYATLLDVPEIMPTYNDGLDAQILQSMLESHADLLPAAFLDIIEQEVNSPKKEALASLLVSHRAPHLSDSQKEVVTAIKLAHPETTIAQIVESLK